MAIDVGPTCSSDAGGVGSNFTMIANANPANAAGNIDGICAYSPTGGDFDFATFTNTSTTKYTSNGASGNLTLSVGENNFDDNDFTPFAVSIGDYAGVYAPAGKTIDIKTWGTPTGSGYKRLYGDQIPCTDADFGADVTAYDVRIYFTGTESGGGAVVAPKFYHRQRLLRQ